MSGAIGYLLGRVHRELGSEAAHGLVRQGLDGARCAPHEVGNLHDRQVGVVAEHERGALALRECGDLSGESLPHRPGQGHGVQPDRSQGEQARGVLPSCAGTMTWPGSQQRDGPRQRPQVLPVDGPWPVTPGSGERLLGQLLGNTKRCHRAGSGSRPRANPLAELDRARLVVHSPSS
jgi:hypothetical protein